MVKDWLIADKRIPLLLQMPATAQFVSCEVLDDDNILCRICDLAAATGDDGLCDGCRSAIVLERARIP